MGNIEPRTLYVNHSIKKLLAKYLLFCYLNSVKMFLRSTMFCIPFTLTSSQFENLSSTSTILANRLLKKTLNGKATAQSYNWLVTLLLRSLGSH